MTEKMMPVQIQNGCAKVRIPVAINAAGEWTAVGFWNWTRADGFDEIRNYAKVMGINADSISFVYALVPLPGGVVAGEVDDDD